MDLGYLFVCALKSKGQGLCRIVQLKQISKPLVEKPSRIFIPTKQVFKMVEVEEVEVQNLEYHRIEEVFEDKESDIFDTILLNGPIDSVKAKLKPLKDQGTEVHGIFKSYFHYFTTEQTLNFLEFVYWCTCN